MVPAALAAMVARLGKECPWTKAQDTHDMIYHARKELLGKVPILVSLHDKAYI